MAKKDGAFGWGLVGICLGVGLLLAGCGGPDADADKKLRNAYQETARGDKPLPPEARAAMEKYLRSQGGAPGRAR